MMDLDGRSVAIPAIIRITRAAALARYMMGRDTRNVVIPAITQRPNPVVKERSGKAKLSVRINLTPFFP